MDSHAGRAVRAATSASLAAISQTAHSITDFVRDVPFARTNLDPLTYELSDLRALLERLQDGVVIPPQLLTPTLSLVGSCGLVLARIDSVLSECGDGPLRSGRWVTKAKDEIRGLKTGLQSSRRALRLALEVANLSAANEFMADPNAIGIGATDIKQDASELLIRIHQLRSRIPGPERDYRGFNVGLLKSLDGMVGFVESVWGDAITGRLERSPLDHDDMAYQMNHQELEPRQSRNPLRQLTHALSRISTSNSNPNSFSSSDSRPTSEASGTWFSTEDEDTLYSKPQRKPSRPPTIQRRKTNETTGSNEDPTTRRFRTSSHASIPAYSLYPPPPTKPLPAIPPQRITSQRSIDSKTPSTSTSRNSKGSATTSSTFSRVSNGSSYPIPPISPPMSPPKPLTTQPRPPTRNVTSDVDIVPWKHLSQNEKDPAMVSYIDVSPTCSVLVSKHGNNIIRFNDLRSGDLQNSIKVSFYVQTQVRSRDFFVHSHAILSETTNLVAIATGFGNTLEIWNWAKKKKLQTIEEAYRWASVRGDICEGSWPPLATYREDNDTIDLYPVNRDPKSKKPFTKPRTIELRKAGIPHIPKCPEMAYSATAPLLVAVAGPRPPRVGLPPPEHAAILMAWELDSNSTPTHRPYQFVMPAHHAELETALPLCLSTYGSVAVSIWIPASYRAVPGRGKQGGWFLEAVTVTHRYVLIWDFAANTTKLWPIPDTLACVSPDCRFVAYCDAKRGRLLVLDAMSGRELWQWPQADLEGKPGFEQLANLDQVTDLSFSGDGKLFFVADKHGGVGVYEVREGKGQGVELWARSP